MCNYAKDFHRSGSKGRNRAQLIGDNGAERACTLPFLSHPAKGIPFRLLYSHYPLHNNLKKHAHKPETSNCMS